MKTISKRVEPENDLTLFFVVGKLTTDELVKAIRDFYDGSITKNVIWDLSRSDLSQISAKDVHQVAALSAEYANRRPSGKTAIIGPDDLTFGLARMYELNKKSLDLPFETQSFRSIDDAYGWILSD
jgi:ABC-type transporter Mla MlaB component